MQEYDVQKKNQRVKRPSILHKSSDRQNCERCISDANQLSELRNPFVLHWALTQKMSNNRKGKPFSSIQFDGNIYEQ